MTTHSRRMFVKLAGTGAAMLSLGTALSKTQVSNAQTQSPLPTPSSLPTAAASAQPAIPDPQMQAVLNELMELKAPPLTEMTPANARQTSPLTIAVQTVLTKQNKTPLELVANIKHLQIPGGARQPMLVRIYYPAGPGPFPALVYFHGGGFVIANLDVYDASCRALTNAANCAVISVAYRLAPEFKFPAAPNDAFAAYQWVLQNAASINVDSAKVAVGGESAGGNLATVTALMARDRGVQAPVHQMLIYPLVTSIITPPVPAYPSYAEFVAAMPLATPVLPWFARHYFRRPADGNSPYASPLRTNVAGLPPATVITAQIDPLRDEGEAYAAKLRDAGVAVVAQRFDGVTHEFFGMGAVVDKAKQAVALAAGELKKAFGTA